MRFHFFAILAFVVWGLTPVFFHYFPANNMAELWAYRIIWSFTLVVLWLKFTGVKVDLKKLWNDKRSFLAISISGVIMNISWYGFVYALSNNYVLDASMAYFIAPILTAGFSWFLFKEKTDNIQRLSLLLMCGALIYLAISQGVAPSLSLVIAVSFAAYMALKKLSKFSNNENLYIENLIQLPAALITVVVIASSHNPSQPDPAYYVLLGAVFLQIIPVFLLSAAISNVNLQKIVVYQYVEPTLHFLLAVFVYHEGLDKPLFNTLIIVWIAIAMWLGNEKKKSSKTNIQHDPNLTDN
ncbi:RarD protein, DMT superfamily transporter [Psychromonas ingrahamii 37]|uniref:RarD protein, DMT superfamily transporter n=1 Tax=Psychromonas ingrahamii (strain DSM 17664 / CCUG 51855 / 37) TaxID=357804 RepID=A1T0V9_PSYIN|nr:EamA family transporter [Psychromonas ingrahamii]ABM05374.1 RarD protein, DMT superfamily transporter [Psychromonas ingrahamii 37]